MKANRNIGAKFFSTVVLVCLFTILFLCPKESNSQAQNYWPTHEWRISTPEEQGVQSKKLADMLELILAQKHSVESVTIIRNGFLVLDAYLYPFKKDTKHIIHSCTKSITSALVGIAIDKSFIKGVNQPILDFFPEITPANLNAEKRAITLEHLLMMAPGLQCQDSYRYVWRGLMEMRQSTDWIKFMFDLPMSEAPGTRFEYCNGASFLLSAIIQKVTEITAHEFAKKHLFEPLGIIDVHWPTNPQGITIGWGEMWLMPHDMAKIGLLYLNKGRWEDRQVVPADWVETSTRRHITGTLFEGYGYQWWIDPAGYYMAVGYLGQFIFVIPDKQMVVVFTSDLEGRSFYIPKKILDQYIIPAAVSSRPIPATSAQTSRLHSLINECAVAPAQGYIWLSEKEGAAKDGLFVRTASPAFKFWYPNGSKKVADTAPNRIMSMKTPKGIRFSSSIHDIPEGMKLSEMGPNHYVSYLSNVGTDIQIISNKEIVLKDGTKAYRTNLKWLYQGIFPVTTLLTATFKDGKCVYVSAHPSEYTPVAELIVDSLTLK
jgi:CubicO group peptidase (beta-lactamase class C family)